MKYLKVTLLWFDAVINLVLGDLLMLWPRFTIELFGLPVTRMRSSMAKRY